MSKGNARQEAKPQTTETNALILINSSALGKKDNLHILHVDDDVGLLEVSKQILLMENNFEIENVTSVDEAFKKMEQQPYDAIVSDYEMPQKNGLEFLKELRDQNNQIPFILFTGKGREDVAVKALNFGADRYINKNGSPETVYCELADAVNKTVERKKSRKLLVASESKYRMLVEKSLQGILVTKSAPLRLVFANEAMGQILGYSPQELLSLSPEGILGLVHQEDRFVFFKRMENRLRGETAEACFEFRAVRKDGSIIWLSALSNQIDYDDQPAVLGMFLDVSENKKAGDILAESEARYRELANCLPDIVFETDINGKVMFANEGAPRLSGYSQDELEAGLNILQFMVPEDRERAMKSIQRLLAGGSYVPTEYTFVRKDGTNFPALVIATPRFFKNKMVGLRGAAIDITERKKAEEELHESEESFRSLIDSMDDLVFVLGFDGIFKNYHQPSDNKRLYTAPEEFVGKHFLGILPTQFAELCQAAMKRIEDTGEIQEFDYYQEINSEKTWFNARLSPKTDDAGTKNSVTVVVRNITERKKAEEALRRSEEKHRIISGITADMTFSCIKKGEEPFFVDWISEQCEKIFGYSAKEIQEKGCWKFAVQPKDFPIFEEKITNLRLGQKSMFELKITNKNGSTQWLKVNAIVNEDSENPGSLRLFGACTDITERKQKELELQLERDKLETVTENIGAGLFLVDKNYKILWTNNMSKHHFGELESKKCYLAFRNLNEVCPDCGVREIFENGKEIDVREHCFKDTKGGPGWLELTARPIKDGTGKIVAALELAVPITGRKKAEEALADSEAKYRALVENADDAILLTDLRGKNIYRNRSHFKSLGFEEGDEAKIEELMKLHPDDVPLLKQKISELFQTGYLTSEYRIRNFNGSWAYRHARSTLIYNIRHQPYAIITIIRDITESKKAEDALSGKEKRFRAIFDKSFQFALILDINGIVLEMNELCYTVHGPLAEASLGKPFWEAAWWGQFSEVAEKTKLAIQNCQVGKIVHDEVEFIDKDFQIHYGIRIFSPIADENGKLLYISVVGLDISERKKAEEELIESEKRSKAIVDYAPIGIATSGVDKCFLSANESFCKILGYSEEELRKLTFKDVTLPKGIKESSLKMFDLEKGRIASFSLEKQYVRKDGTVIDGKIMVNAVLDQNGKPNLFVAELEDITERKKAEEVRKVLESKVKQYSEHLKNMVDLRTAQLKDANERLVKAERLAAIGELAGMIGHDLRNPLAGIKNGVYILKKKGSTISEAQAKETLEIIDKAIDHSNKIINDLLDYSREMNLKLIKYAARPLVDEAARMIQVPDRIQIINHVDEEACIWVDADKMIRVFVNLLQNAIDATPENGRLEITNCQRSNFVEIAFSDTGKGIPAEVLPKLFTPLFTTKAQGMGFGLAICKRIVEVHGGTIKVESIKDKGTKFIINMPVKSYPEPENKTIG